MEDDDKKPPEYPRIGNKIILGSKPNRSPNDASQASYSSLRTPSCSNSTLDPRNCALDPRNSSPAPSISVAGPSNSSPTSDYIKPTSDGSNSTLDTSNLALGTSNVTSDTRSPTPDTSNSSPRSSKAGNVPDLIPSSDAKIPHNFEDNAASTSKAEICNHCNVIFPDNSAIVKHLLDVIKPTIADVSNSEYSDVDPLGILETRKAKKRKLKHSNVDQGDSSFEKRPYFYTCRVCNVDYPNYRAARVHKQCKHPDIPKSDLFFKCPIEQNILDDENNDSDGQKDISITLSDSEEAETDEVQRKEFQKLPKIKISKVIDDSRKAQYNLKRIASDEDLPSKRLKIEKTTEDVKETVKLFKCPCGIHYTSHKSIQKHFEICRPSNKISKQTCIKCGYLFAKDIIVNHLLKYHSKDDYKFKVVNVTPDMKDIYKCGSCDVLFYVKSDLVDHFDKCDLKSENNSHFVKECVKLEKGGYNVVTINNPEITQTSKREEQNVKIKIVSKNPKYDGNLTEGKTNIAKLDRKRWIFKCARCNIHYLTPAGIKYHFQSEHKSCFDIVLCEVCELKFPVRTKRNHFFLHHKNMKLQLEDLHIEVVSSYRRVKYLETLFRNASLKVPNNKDKTIIKEKVVVNKELTVDIANISKKKKKKLTHSNKIYKCTRCNVHCITNDSFYEHNSNENCGKPASDCKTCGIKFSSQELPQHVLIHHVQMNLKHDQFVIIDKNEELQSKGIKSENELLLAESEESSEASDETESDSDSKDSTDPEPNQDHKEEPESKKRSDNISVKDSDSSDTDVINDKNNDSVENPKKKETLVGRKLTDGELESLKNRNFDNYLYKCVKCSLHFLHHISLETHINRNTCNKAAQRKCPTCGLAFSMLSLSRHEYVHHEKMKLQLKDLIITTTKSKPTFTRDVKIYPAKIATKVIKTAPTIAIAPTIDRTLYKCGFCDKHFMNLDRLQCHLKNGCANSGKATACVVCGLKFSDCFLTHHEYVHHTKLKLQLDDFKIITIPESKSNKDSSSRNLKLADEKQSKNHRASSAQNLKISDEKQLRNLRASPAQNLKLSDEKQLKNLRASPAQNLKLSDEKQSKNLRASPAQNLKLSDEKQLKNIGASSSQNSKSVKSKTKINKESPSKKIKLSYKTKPKKLKDLPSQKLKLSRKFKKQLNSQPEQIRLYKCTKCLKHFVTTAALQTHLYLNTCLKKLKKSFDCPTCGYAFSGKSLSRHMYVHHEKLNLQKKDIVVTTSLENKLIHKPRKFKLSLSLKCKRWLDSLSFDNRLHKCKNCSKYFMSHGSLKSHIEVCSSHSESEAFDCSICGYTFSHTSLIRHMYVHHDKMNLQTKDFVIVYGTNNGQYIKSSSSKGQTSYKVLYKCHKCSLHFFTQRLMRRHSLMCTKTLKVNKRTCDICGLDFTAQSLIRHKNYHHIKLCLKLSDFIIRPITDKSKDGRLKSTPKIDLKNLSKEFKLTAKQMGILDSGTLSKRLYKCGTCPLHFITYNTMIFHRRVCKKEKINSHKCQICNRCFTFTSLKYHIYIHHTKLKLINDFIIMDTFNKVSETHVLYKCEVCGVHFSRQSALYAHRSRPIHVTPRTTNCKLCGLLFSASLAKRHRLIHHRQMGLKLKDFVIRDDYKNEKHGTDKRKRDNPTKSSKDSIEFDENSDNKTLISNDESSRSEASEDINDSLKSTDNRKSNSLSHSNILYKCHICRTYYLSRRYFSIHMVSGVHKTGQSVECDICHYTFTKYALSRHVNTHHTIMNLKREDFIIKTYWKYRHEIKNLNSDEDSVNDDKKSEIDTDLDDDKLDRCDEMPEMETQAVFKCKSCNVHFIDKEIFKLHKHNHKTLEPKQYTECKLCGLQFTIYSLHKHIEVHHDDAFDFDKVVIEEWEIDDSGDKTNTYVAADKVQSGLITTTTDVIRDTTKADRSSVNIKIEGDL